MRRIISWAAAWEITPDDNGTHTLSCPGGFHSISVRGEGALAGTVTCTINGDTLGGANAINLGNGERGLALTENFRAPAVDITLAGITKTCTLYLL